MHLMELLEHFETASALTYFRSDEARKEGSKARTLIECGKEWLADLREVDLARILFGAIGLGGQTLKLYKDWMQGVEPKK